MLGYGPEDKTTVLELTYNYGVTEYDKGNAYAQVNESSSLSSSSFLMESSDEVSLLWSWYEVLISAPTETAAVFIFKIIEMLSYPVCP